MPFIRYQDKIILFVHIPKTGGSSIEYWMQAHAKTNLWAIPIPEVLRCSPQHLTYDDIIQIFDASLFDYAFTIVRNPYDRLESEYKWQFRGEPERQPFLPWFARTLRQYMQDAWLFDNHIRPQKAFLGKKVQVFRLEDGMANIMAEVSKNTGLPLPPDIPHARDSRSFANAPTPVEWDTHMRQLVNDFYADDFEQFGYEMVE